MATQPRNFYTIANYSDEEDSTKLDAFIKKQTAHNKAERQEFVTLSNQVQEINRRLGVVERDKVSFDGMQSYVNLIKVNNTGKKASNDSEDEKEGEEEEEEDSVVAEQEAEWRRNYDQKYKKLKERYKGLKDLPERVLDLENKRIKQKTVHNNTHADIREKMLTESMRFDIMETDVERHTKDIKTIKEDLKRKLDNSYLSQLPDRSPKRVCLEEKVKKLSEQNEALTDLVLEMSKLIGNALGDGNKNNPFLAKIKAVMERNKH